MFILIYSTVTFISIFCLFKFYTFSKNPSSIPVVKSRRRNVLVHLNLRKKIKNIDDRKFSRLNESMRIFREKEKKWKRKVESPSQFIQRRNREVLKKEVHILVNSFGLNLDALVLFLKVSIMYIFVCIFFIFSNNHFYLPIKIARIAVIVLSFFLLHIVFHKLVLREMRFWFWRPYPAIFHVHAKGFQPNKIAYILLILYFIHAIWWMLLVLFVLFLCVRFDQTYLRKRAHDKWLGVVRILLWHWIMEFYNLYAKYLKPFVTFFFKYSNPVVFWIWRNTPKPRLPHGWRWI